MSESNGSSVPLGATSLPVRDEDAALAVTGGDAALARELLASLLAGLPAELQGLLELRDTGDWRGIDDAVHRLRGATAYCAVPALDQALTHLKEAAKAGDKHRISSCLVNVELEAERLSVAIA